MDLEFTFTKTNDFFCFLLQWVEYYHFFRVGSSRVIEDKKVDSGGFALANVRYGAFVGRAESLEMVDGIALHVNDFDVDVSDEVLKVYLHLPVVGVRRDLEGP